MKTAKILLYLASAILVTTFFAFVFLGKFILPQTLFLGFISIRYYGLIMALAVAGAFYLAKQRAGDFGISHKTAEDIIFWLIIGGFAGARLYHVISSFDYYFNNPSEIIKIWHGGLSIYGALFGGMMTLWILRKILHLKSYILDLLDWLTPSVLLGQIVGRFGNLFNYEAFGLPTNVPWKMFVPYEFRQAGYEIYESFHPWFLYEQIANIIILILLLKVLKFRASGQLVFTYLLLYNTVRFFLEFLRLDSVIIFGFRQNALVSLLFACISATGLYICSKQNVKIS